MQVPPVADQAVTSTSACSPTAIMSEKPGIALHMHIVTRIYPNLMQVAAGYVLHIGEVQGILNVGDTIKARIDCKRRYRIAANHTMTHIMNYALREVC